MGGGGGGGPGGGNSDREAYGGGGGPAGNFPRNKMTTIETQYLEMIRKDSKRPNATELAICKYIRDCESANHLAYHCTKNPNQCGLYIARVEAEKRNLREVLEGLEPKKTDSIFGGKK